MIILTALCFGVICFLIAKRKQYPNAACVKHGIIGVFLGPIWLIVLLCKKNGAEGSAPFREAEPGTPAEPACNPALMTSQYAAYYALQASEAGKNQYIRRLTSLGLTVREAEKLLRFECDSILKFDKKYLLDDGFTESWLFSLREPVFIGYPKEKDDLLKERFFTVSELAKLMDEAEWHLYNSHESDLPEGVFAEIFEWHLKGHGGAFGIWYFEMISEETGVPVEKLSAYCSHEGQHLSRYKWR